MKIGTNTNHSSTSLLNAQKSKSEISPSLEKVASSKTDSEIDTSSKNTNGILKSKIASLSTSIKNINDGVGYLQIADKILNSLHSSGEKLGELANSKNQTKTIISQINVIKEDMSRAVNNATYNGKNVFSGNFDISISTSGIISTNIDKPKLDEIDSDSIDSILDFIKDISKTRGEIKSAINTLSDSANENSEAIINLTQSRVEMKKNGASQNYDEVDSAFLKENSSLYSASFNTESLKSKLDSLLA